MREEYQIRLLSSWQGGWESVNGNPDVYIFQGSDSSYYLLSYYYDKEYGRGSFSCYSIYSDGEGCYICMGMSRYRLSEEQAPYGLHIAGWGSYIKN